MNRLDYTAAAFGGPSTNTKGLTIKGLMLP